MAVKTGVRSQDFSQRFWYTLSRAICELCVIILLHVAATTSYVATRLAHISRLRAPCTMCSRLDQALHGKAWFSADLVCAAHRSEISSLAYCKSHNNLAHSADLCKRCHAACTLAGFVDEVNSRSGSRSRQLCSCCLEPFKKACIAHKLYETADVKGPSHNVHGLDEIKQRSQVVVIEKINPAMPPKFVPEQVSTDHSKVKVGIEEVRELDASPGTYEQSTKDNGASSNAGLAAKPAPNASSLPSRIFVDRNNSIKNTFVGRVNLPSPRPSEIISARDNNSTTQQEVKALLTQMSSVRGLDYSWTEGVSSTDTMIQNDESNGTSRRPYLERNYSVLESSDANLGICEAEGEISLESLKRQIEINKKSMLVLYKELEEERSASAIAASQAMAMINRLHEEKAAMQMEALQYLRMMEEQADHDHEAIQNLHDLLTEREKALLDMDAELDSCRRLLQHDQFNGGNFDDTVDNTPGYDKNVSFDVLNASDFMTSTMSGFEEEKAYILESLGRLEEKLRISTYKLASDDAKNIQETLLGDHIGDESTSFQQSIEQKDKDECSCSPFDNEKISGLNNLQDEISLLDTRLRALEDDHEFLKRVLSSLKGDGLQCVRDIMSHLHELRRVAAQ
ncbi:myosin-binding protein 3 [Aegilops tauschii subsp. strangulata]|uniref:GTD-binding domain-containing protein n=4 Tax=Aegilops tauschii TaxID=37682 RepID=A0A452Y9U2_AEGTS|nr:myosin-binding protein 1 [Aegilops tauschii subsp. strangulata]XP_020195548.1 myosin-binding protein 1 [Aegilops tauschii subsp. strangulata]XP_040257098.1 myosin-binding protein 1 [Aegilops tauschii subsp. strangulata]XP_040257104.1 myosin-binding protein 1 [Aegilops tauschii subsp. strangulata]XP_040257109.1 myosin-binding protein 1 [Aegilops tauschii subsp. strangulata]XP_040257112.1 myosin-binding protein 1 [Aegilops tauschii subsp. strangulata]XP_045089610.1 myosin-binding protein 1 [